jgi:purine-binding chemotaxis protein CheW
MRKWSIGRKLGTGFAGLVAGLMVLGLVSLRAVSGLRVLQVREMMGLQDTTTAPNTPPSVRGVIDLRGKVIPVVCLHSKFGTRAAEATSVSCIIVVQVENQGAIPMGIVVDAVSDVLNIVLGEIEDTPDFGSGRTTPYLLGMAKVKAKVKILLGIDRVVQAGELAELGELAHEQDA